MTSLGGWLITFIAMPLLLAACQSQDSGGVVPASDARSSPTAPRESDAVVLMPDLVGLASAEAGRRIGELEDTHRLGLSSGWRSQAIVGCGTRPDSVIRQQPAPGTPLERGTVVEVRTAVLDLEEFRGPCAPADGDLGPLAGPDGALAREFYRFAANPSLGAPFVDGEVWVGIDSGLTAIRLSEAERADLASWELGTGYAEATGPFSPLDVLASSGGYYELHRGVVPTCPRGDDTVPPGFAELRSISLTAPSDTTSACSQWWGVTLFLDGENRIRGVALRLGSP